jgi:hypothetical protein
MTAPPLATASLAPLPRHTLQAFAGALTAERVLAAALAIDAARTADRDAELVRWHGFDRPGLVVTPFQFQAAAAARQRGIFAFNRQERAFLAAPASWRHRDMPASTYQTARAAERLVAHGLWPFHQDCPVGDWELSAAPRWWSHGLVHAMVGFGWWPALTEWELMHMARLGEMVAALHWYWLGELGRDYCPQHSIRSGDSTPDCAACAALEAGATSASTRAERITGAGGRMIADNAVQVLAYEVGCYRQGIYEGQLAVAPAEYLAAGEACEYARVHHRRLTSPAMARYVEHCLRPSVDYATSPAEFEVRCADALNALMSPEDSGPPAAAARAMTVLRDVGARLCHAAALHAEAGRAVSYDRGLRAVADALGLLAQPGRADADGLVAAALEEVAADLHDGAGATPLLTQDGPVPAADAVLALGYRPAAAEPAASLAARRAALVRRGFAIHAAVGVTARELEAASDQVLASPRRPSVLLELFEAATAAAEAERIEGMPAAFAGYVVVLAEAWEGLDPAAGLGQRWYYRLASTSLPDDAEAAHWRIVRNPYLTELPVPFDLGWLEQTLTAPLSVRPTGPFAPRYTTSAPQVYAGPGRERLVVLPATEARQRLWARAFSAPTVAECLSDARLTRDTLAAALAEHLVLCLHLDNPYARWPRPDDLQYADVDEDAADS